MNYGRSRDDTYIRRQRTAPRDRSRSPDGTDPHGRVDERRRPARSRSRPARRPSISRSRQSLWVKGETSGNTLAVHAVYADCDDDTLVLLVDPGRAVLPHRAAGVLFPARRGATGSVRDVEHEASAFLFELEQEIAARASPGARRQEELHEELPRRRRRQDRRQAARRSRRALGRDGRARATIASRAKPPMSSITYSSACDSGGVPLRRVIEVLASRQGVERARRKIKSSETKRMRPRVGSKHARLIPGLGPGYPDG